MAEDIKDLPSLHGFVKFPDGFPAARIKLEWQDYPHRADGFERVTTMRAADYVPTEEEAAEMGVDGREGDGPDNKPKKVLEADVERSEAELEAEQLREEVERSLGHKVDETERALEERQPDRETTEPPKEEQDTRSQFRFQKAKGEKDYRERQKQVQRDTEERESGKNRHQHQRDQRSREDGQESELLKENQRGFGEERREYEEHAIDDEQEIGL
jgi:hypothetical protein